MDLQGIVLVWQAQSRVVAEEADMGYGTRLV